MKRIIIISISVLILLATAAGGYFFLTKKSAPIQMKADAPTLNKLSDDIALSPVVTYDGSAVWYFNARGQMFRRSLDGQNFTEYPLPSLITGFKKAAWPSSGSDFIVTSNTGAGELKNLYDSKAKEYKLLPDNIQSFDWMPDGQRIVYVWKSGDGKHQQLMLANSDGSGYKVIKDVFWPDLVVKVSPDGKNALLVRSEATDPNSVYLVDLGTGEFKTVMNTGKNLAAKWVTPTKFVYLVSVNNANDLMLYDLSTGQSTDLNLNTTMDRVTTDNRGNLYYAVNDGRVDVIWKMDTSGVKSMVYQLDSVTHPRYLFMNDLVICFTATDGKIYYIN